MTRPLLVKPDEATSFTPVRERFPSFPRNATLGWGRAFQLQFGNPPAILQIGQKRYTIEQFIQTRRETLYEVDVIEEDRQHRYWDLPDTAKIIGPWQWTGAAGDSTTAGANRAKYLIVNPNEVPTPSEQLTDLSAEDLNHLVAKEFHRVSMKKCQR